eukprot:3457016-Prymnesium_polylepis.1
MGRPTNPETACDCEERECAPRSSSCTLLVVVEAAGPVAGVIGDMMRLRSAVDEATRNLLHDVGQHPAGRRQPASGSAALRMIHALSEPPRRAARR